MEGEVLRDDQWERIKPFVPGGLKGKRGPRSNGRRFIDALLWMTRSGARWRDLPERFGPYRSVKRRYYRWIEMGVLNRIFEAAPAAVKRVARMTQANERAVRNRFDGKNGENLVTLIQHSNAVFGVVLGLSQRSQFAIGVGLSDLRLHLIAAVAAIDAAQAEPL